MEELTELLNEIEDSYEDFVLAITHYSKKNTSRLDAVLDFLRDNPYAKSSDVIGFVSNQSDFVEDAAYVKVC